MQSQTQQQQQQQLQPSSLAEDDVIKKNTDCVYFLASPLTCKKGKECEFRHSDLARLNPRDCYYWLQGNCLNPKCSFRHPPLDGLLEKQKPTPTGPSHAFQANSTAFAHVPNVTNTPGVPCIFFQKGYCLKGDWCPFLHGPPNPTSNKVSLVPELAPSFEPAPFKKAFSGVDKFAQGKKVPPTSVAKTPHAKSATEMEFSIPKAESFGNKKTPHTSVVSDFHEHKNITSVRSGYLGVHQPQILDERRSVNDREAGEISREPSPGFDVLVDDERGDAHYYPDEDRYEMSRDHEVRNEHAFTDHYPREHRVSHERMPGGSSFERSPYGRVDSRVEVDVSDLRHRLANPKKSNGLRSVISHEYSRDRHDEDRRLPRRDMQHLPRHENSVSSRLRGRIRLPERSSSPIERDMVRSRDRGRLSPVMPNLSLHPGRRTHDRIRGMVEEDFSSGRRNRRDVMYNDSANFAAPKRLSELKNRKNGEHSEERVTDQQLPGKRKLMELEDHKITGNDASFQGPKPLQEILKRKRGDTIGIVGSRDSSNNEDIVEDINQNAGQDSVNQIENEEIKVHPEDNIPVEDGVEQEYEAYEEEGYEQVGGEEELYDGDENGYIEGEEEFHDEEDDDDDDDFAKKMGVDFS